MPKAEEDNQLGDDLDMEEKLHEHDKMNSMAVIEAEMAIMQQLMKTCPDSDRSIYEFKFNSLEFAKGNIETNIGIGVLTPQKYLIGLKNYLKY